MNISSLLYKAINQNEKIKEQIQEIRIRVGRPIILKLHNLDTRKNLWKFNLCVQKSNL